MRQFLIAFDQMLNTVAWGWADETLSARAWRRGETHEGWNTVRSLIDLLFFWQDQHCLSSYMSEQNRKHLPREYRNDSE